MDSTGSDSPRDSEINELTYEQAAERLESVLESLESGELSLEESLALYELGAALAEHCELKIEEAELRVRKWQSTGQAEPLTDWQEEQG